MMNKEKLTQELLNNKNFMEWANGKGASFWKHADKADNYCDFVKRAFMKAQGIMTAEEKEKFLARKISIAQFNGKDYALDLFHTSEFVHINGIAYIHMRGFFASKDAQKNDTFTVYKEVVSREFAGRVSKELVAVGTGKVVCRA